MKNHICIVTPYHYSVYKGGNELFAHELARVANKSFKVSYVTSTRASSNDYHVVSIAHSLHSSYAISTKLIKKVFSLKPNIIHTSGTQASMYLILLIARAKGIPTVHSYHAPTTRNTYARMLKNVELTIITKLATHITVLNRQILKIVGSITPNCSLLIPPIYPSPKISKKRLRSLVIIANLDKHHYYKGVHLAIKVMSLLDDKWTLNIIGDGPLLEQTKLYANKANVSHKCIFHGRVSEKKKRSLLALSSIYLHPSTSNAEGFGISAAEALGCYTPVITTTVTGIAGIIRKFSVGIVIYPNNLSALKQAIISIDSKKSTFPKKNFTQVFNELSSKTFSEKLVTIYNSLV